MVARYSILCLIIKMARWKIFRGKLQRALITRVGVLYMRRWTETEDMLRKKLLRQGKTYSEIAENLNTQFQTNTYTAESVRSRTRRDREGKSALMPFEGMGFDELLKAFNQRMGFYENGFLNKDYPVARGAFAVFSDLHVPLCDKEALANAVMLAKHEGATQCIIAGDYLDTASFSPHFLYSDVSIEDEIKEAKAVSAYLDSHFDEVIYVLGNHELWYNKAKAKLPNEFKFLLKDFLIEYIIADMPNSHFIDKFYYQQGDCIVGHPSMFRQKRMSDVIVGYNYFDMWKSVLGLQDVRCYVHAHTHRLGSIMLHDGGRIVKLFEGGALTGPAEHISLGHTVNYAPPTPGIVIIKQDDNLKTIFNESREFCV